MHGHIFLNWFLFPHNSFVSTWPMRRCTTISMKCFFYTSKQNVYKRELPWKQLILLVTRLEYWIFFSRYSYNIITECMPLNMLETNNFLSRGLIFEVYFYMRLQCIYNLWMGNTAFSKTAFEGHWKDKILNYFVIKIFSIDFVAKTLLLT